MPDGQSGRFVNKSDRKIIVLNNKDKPFRKRFTALHEMAHQILDLPSKHGNAISGNDLYSYSKRPEEERICDVFAAECLVPHALFAPMIDGVSFSIDEISKFSDMFEASIPCVASRFAQYSDEMHSYVLSESGIIQNVVSSRSVKESRLWISHGRQLPKDSGAAIAIKNHENYGSSRLEGYAWSGSDCANKFIYEEEAINLHAWDQTVSLLTIEPTEADSEERRDQDDEEDKLLEELTGELRWRKR